MSTPDVRVQVPPRPPKKQSKGCFFFHSFRPGSTAQKTLKALGFPTKTGIQGLLCCFSAILIYLSLFSTISVPNVGTPVGAPTNSPIALLKRLISLCIQKNLVILFGIVMPIEQNEPNYCILFFFLNVLNVNPAAIPLQSPSRIAESNFAKKGNWRPFGALLGDNSQYNGWALLLAN